MESLLNFLFIKTRATVQRGKPLKLSFTLTSLILQNCHLKKHEACFRGCSVMTAGLFQHQFLCFCF